MGSNRTSTAFFCTDRRWPEGATSFSISTLKVWVTTAVWNWVDVSDNLHHISAGFHQVTATEIIKFRRPTLARSDAHPPVNVFSRFHFKMFINVEFTLFLSATCCGSY